MITRAIHKAFKRIEERGWQKTYWAFDVHETIIKPNWDFGNVPTEFYPLAKEEMQMITKRSDIVTFLYTCSHPSEIQQYLDMFEENNIHFDYVNKNPEVKNEGYGYYNDKPYFNVLFEDKAGFDPLEDWPLVIQILKEKGIKNY